MAPVELSNYKLQFTNISYKVNKEKCTVIALVKFRIMETGDSGRVQEVFTSVGKAKSAPKDFVEEIGKKLARARAEKYAYTEFKLFLKDKLKQITILIEQMEETLMKDIDYIQHQEDYIKTF